MRRVAALIGCLAALAAVAWLLNAVVTAWSQRSRGSPQTDLALEMDLGSGPTIEPGQQVWVKLTLVNRSTDRVHRVAMPGQGSLQGAREPHVHYTARHTDASGLVSDLWHPRLVMLGGRARGAEPEVLALRPGQRLVLQGRFDTLPSDVFEFQQPGSVEVRAHYVASGGEEAGLQPLSITSNPIKFEVIRPLDLSLQVTGSLKRGAVARWTGTFRVVMKNISGAAANFDMAAPGIVVFDLDTGGSTYGTVRVARQGSLKPGEEIVLTDDGPDLTDWQSQLGATVRIRAQLYVSVAAKEENGRQPHVRSAWVTVPVED